MKNLLHQKMQINIYTDGSSKGNPGKGGYGVIIKNKDHYLELSQGYNLTTNNRMELLAVIVGLESIKKENQTVLVTSDSKYVIDSVAKGWVFNWERKGFKKKKNPDLWKRFLIVYRKHNVSFFWIRGHSGHKENERCDQLAVDASTKLDLKADVYFESLQNNPPNLFNS